MKTSLRPVLMYAGFVGRFQRILKSDGNKSTGGNGLLEHKSPFQNGADESGNICINEKHI